MRILLVDDDDFSGEMTAEILENAGHEVSRVNNGVDAIERLASDVGFSAVVSDMNMPFISGLDLFESLREGDCQLPFILLSGEDSDVLWQRQPYLNDCIAKDSHLENRLLQALERISSTRT